MKRVRRGTERGVAGKDRMHHGTQAAVMGIILAVEETLAMMGVAVMVAVMVSQSRTNHEARPMRRVNMNTRLSNTVDNSRVVIDSL